MKRPFFLLAVGVAGVVTLSGSLQPPAFADGGDRLAQASPASSTSKPAIQTGLLVSERGVNYNQLQDLLRAGSWQEANRLTSRLVLQLANQQQRGYLVATDIRSLPCTDLYTIDRLWMYYSDSRFGFTPQAEIWRGLGGRTYEDSLWFEAFVGWQGDEIASASPTTAPRGYLPFRPAYDAGIRNAFGGGWLPEMPLRLEACRQQRR